MEFIILYNNDIENDDCYNLLECDFIDEKVITVFFKNSKYTLKDILKKENISECLNKEKNYIQNEEENDDIDNEVLFKICDNKYKELIKKIENIDEMEYTIKLENIDDEEYIASFKDFIKNNSFLEKCKVKIEIIENFDLSKSSYQRAVEVFKNFKNVSFSITGNDNAISIDEFRNTIIKIDELMENVKKYNLSPFEQLLYVYDIVKNRVYKEENSNEDNSISRDLTSVLFGNNIVCLGYARVYDTILKKLGISSKVVYLYPKDKNEKSGHARNVCYVKDDKYNINGIYYFDPTWDSKIDINDNEYLNRYNYFCRNKDFFDEIGYIDSSFGLLENNNSSETIDKNMILNEIEKVKKLDLSKIDLFDFIDYKNNANLVYRDVIYYINNILKFTNNEKFLLYDIFQNYNNLNKEKIIEQMNKCIELYYPKDIDESTFLEALYSVRKVQYYSDPNRYEIDGNSIKKATIGYKINLNLINEIYNKDTQNSSEFIELMKAMFIKETVKNKYKNENYDKKIGELKFTKILSKILEKKKGNN